MKSKNTAPPRTYAEWAAILDKLKEKTDDEAVLSVMQQGNLEWQTGVAERFADRLIDVVNCRMNGASDKFQKEINRSCFQERTIVQALLSLRKEIAFLLKTVNLPAIPEKSRQQFCQLIIDHADSMQTSLEDSAKSDKSGKLRSIVKNNRINALYMEGQLNE